MLDDTEILELGRARRPLTDEPMHLVGLVGLPRLAVHDELDPVVAMNNSKGTMEKVQKLKLKL